jgi:MerR family transcriptional regulator, light-induced transcriptional regulator
LSPPIYRIGTVARLTGLSTHAIRVWERRYGAAAPSRTAGGARLYGEHDVQRFKLIKRLLDSGYSTRAIANLDLAELSELALPNEAMAAAVVVGVPEPRQVRPVIEALLEAVGEMNVELAERVLVRAGNDFSPRDLVTTVLAPALEEIGARWASGELCTASEHAASALLRTRLGALLAAQPVGKSPPVVCTTPSGEQHELGALLVAVLIAMTGRRAVFLGANLPAEQIVEAVRLSRAGGVALSVVVLPPEDTRRELKRLLKLLPVSVELVVGGRGTTHLGQIPPRARILRSLPELEAWLDGLSKKARR